MVPKPKQNNPQSQPITTTLANILRSYPAGGTVLRELLQNADDAGASKIDFHLSTLSAAPPTTPPTTPPPLLDPGLLEYQGPAIIAHNSHPPFSRDDLQSLSLVGDSLKRHDPTKTGKFGLGFNSVYNWTDCPSILSGRDLLLLDPNHFWSAKIGHPGGPLYDFVDDADQVEMVNQLKPFSDVLVSHDLRGPLDGTAIRLPLRTKEQAQKSKICQTSVGVEEMREVMRMFAEGLGSGYGVFLKNIDEIGLWEDGRKIGGCRVVNQEEVREARTKINEAYSDVFVNRNRAGFTLAFIIEVELSLRDGGDSRKRWAVYHMMQQDVGPELTEWGMEEKLFAWVGVAVPLQFGKETTAEHLPGGLFTVLPLGQPSGHPAHLHGMFSITSDRANIHCRTEKGLQDQRPFLWNQKLFSLLIPTAWASLLDHLRRREPQMGDLMDYWPRPESAVGELGEELCQTMFERVRNSSLQVFFTEQGFVSLETGFFAKADKVGEELRLALKQAGIPVVYIQQQHLWLHDEVLAHCPGRLLSSETLCNFLRPRNSLESVSVDSKRSLLEYILSGVDIGKPGVALKPLYGPPLFRLGDGTYQALDENIPPIFLSVGETEERLFRLQPERNLDLRLLSAETVGILRELSLVGTTPIRRHSVTSFIEYCERKLFLTPLSVDQDVIPFSPILRELIDDIWDWIMANASEPDVFREISSLWLMPLYGGRSLRRLNTVSSIPTLHSLSGTTGQLLIRLTDPGSQSVLLPLLCDESLGPRSQRFLVEHGETRYGISLGSCEVLKNLLPWLVAGKEAVRAATDEDKELLLTIIAKKFVVDRPDIAADALAQLPLFERVASPFVGGDMERKREWVDKPQGQSLIGIGDLPFPPNVGGRVVFIRSGDRNVRDMLSETGIAKWPTTAKLIKAFLIENLAPEDCNILSDDVKIQTLELILCNHIELSPKCRVLAGKLPIVPVEITTPIEEKQAFRPMSELLDPRSSDIKGFFFTDELSYPRTSLLDRFDGVLQHYGLKSTLTWELAVERIRLYAATERPLEEVMARARTLLRLPIGGDNNPSASELQEVKDLEWVVTKSVHTQQLVKMKPLDCPGARYRLIVGRVASVLEFNMHVKWRELLGWTGLFDASVLERQLRIGIAEMDMDIVNAVLAYILEQGLPASYLDAIRPMDCAFGSSGRFFTHTRIFLKGAARLQPYSGVVEPYFWKQHRTLLEKLGVAKSPSLDDLFWVQEQLVALKQPLDEADIAVAVEVVKRASCYDRNKLTGLKIPDQTGCLQQIEDITYWDMHYSSEGKKVSLVHSEIPSAVAEKLCIQKFSDQKLMDELGVDDREDEDEYFQHEETTTRITDTLYRYSITSTFSEYLANAEDSQATCIDWLLDECLEGNYPAEGLLSKDLQPFQGQALFVHNDGVFLDEDFDGFKKVGRGSKREEEWAIGQFGRGAQTMYHWTDVPMIISGKYFLILDPQQKFLPLNRKSGQRKPGMKVELRRLRESCRDQLAPFDGLWNYSTDLDEYEGTIFRFPLRLQGSETKLTESTQYIGCTAAQRRLEEYFSVARTSLLFLQYIKQISFGLRREEEPRFRVQRLDHPSQPLTYQPFESVYIEHSHMSTLGRKIEGKDDWRIAKQDILTVPKELQECQRRTKKKQKYPRCGIAALLSYLTIPGFKPTMFSTLPLEFRSHLPVHINASFALSGDRQSVLVGETSRFEGSAWNKWLLQECIPDLYLQFLEELVRMLGTDVFKFWPTRELSKDNLSDHIRQAFWERIPSSRCRLYPRAKSMAPGPVIKTGRGGRSRDVLGQVISWELKEAMFDFVCRSSSPRLQDLVRTWFPNLIRVNVDNISKDLQALAPAINEMIPLSIRKKLQTADACDELEKCFKVHPGTVHPGILDDILPIIWPKRDAEMGELDGCRILPLQDGSLGTLRLAQSDSRTYFSTTLKEKELFNFASGLFVKDGGKYGVGASLHGSNDFLQWLIKCKAFNVRKLEIRDVKQVLLCKSNDDWRNPTQDHAGWLTRFWTYFNKEYDSKTGETGAVTVAQCGIQDFQVFQLKKGNDTFYMSPNAFESLPAVVGTNKRVSEALLCQQFPDLYVADPAFMPDSLSREDFLPRFLKAVKDIATAQGIPLEEFLSSALDERCIKVLRDLTLTYISLQGLGSAASNPAYKETKRIIKLLPIWPSIAGPGTFLTAAASLASRDDALLVPWLNNRSRFVSPGFFRQHIKELNHLGIQALDAPCVFRDYVLPSLPQRLSLDQITHYQGMLDVIVKLKLRNVLLEHRNYKLAVDGSGAMHQARELYDHTDNVYSAAFGLQDPRRFLHPALRKYRTYWIAMGLRGGQNTPIDGSEYAACIQSLQTRIVELQVSNAPSALSISSTVLQGLARLVDVPSYARASILAPQVVYSATDWNDEPAYRRNNIDKFKERKTLLTLSEVVHREYAPFCWTQVQFPLHDLPRFGLQALSISGKPPISAVWDHLEALVKVAATLQHSDVKPFLADLSSTYGHLQDNTAGPGPDLNGKMVWLNINLDPSIQPTVSEINSSWIDVKHLLLFCPFDPEGMQSVRSFLTPYQDLLKRCGCKPIRIPTWKEVKRPSPHSLPGEILRLWKDSKLTDVIFEAGGERVSAHRLVLAAASKKYESRFAGAWASSQDASKPIVLNGINHATLLLMLEFAYHGQLDFQPLQAHEGDDTDVLAIKLDGLLDLLAGADEWLMPRLHAEVEYQIMSSVGLYIRPDNVRGILRAADRTNAKELANYCRVYCSANSETMEVVDDEVTDDEVTDDEMT